MTIQLFKQKIIKHEQVQYISNQIGQLNEVIDSESIELEDNSKWVHVGWRPTAGGINLIFENVDFLQKENGCYDFNKQQWDRGVRIEIKRKHFNNKLTGLLNEV